MASYRYWKLAVPSGWFALAALQFYSDGRCTTKVNGTFTTDNTTYGIVDMGSSVVVDSVCFAGGGAAGLPISTPFSILGSADGITYTSVFSSTLNMTGYNIILPTSIGAPNNGWNSYAMGNLTTAVSPLSATISLLTTYPDAYQSPGVHISPTTLVGGYLVNDFPAYDFIPTTYQWESFSSVGAFWSDMVGATSKDFPTALVNNWPSPVHTGFQYRLKITQAGITGTSNILSVTAFAVGGTITGPSTVVVGTPITLGTSVYGGNLVSWTYNWSGTDSVSGATSSLTKTYTTTGTKTVNVTVSSGGASTILTKTITVIQEPIIATITATPTTGPISQDFAFSVSGVSGGVTPGSYTYSWSGPDGLTGTGTSVNKVFSSIGTKTVTCTITSGGYSNVFTVDVTVTAPAITGSITATPTSVVLGSPISFVMNAAGGTGSYTYNWTGDDSFSGTIQTVNKTFSSIGTKNVTCAVTSGGVTTNFTTQVTVTAVPSLVVSITPSVSKQLPNAAVNFTSTVSGGTGSYTYSWSTTDGFTSTLANPSFTWATLGAKTVTLTVTSGTQNVSATANITIVAALTSRFGRLCFVG
jgi:PKD repeat protein